MRSQIEQWLRKQIAAEAMGNLFLGGMLLVLSLPLNLLNLLVIWVLVKLFTGGSPVNELLGPVPMAWDKTIPMTIGLYVLWLLAYLGYRDLRAYRAKNGYSYDPPILDYELIFFQILFAAPATFFTAVDTLLQAVKWTCLDVPRCCIVMARLLASPRRVPVGQLRQEYPDFDWDSLLAQLKLIPGVVFLSSPPSGLSLTSELRGVLTGRRMKEDYEETFRENRVVFACQKCGHKLRVRRFLVGDAIRCPGCQSQYRIRLDARGHLKLDPEFKQERRTYQKPPQTELGRFYTVLGLTTKATVQEVRSAYRKLMKRYHPDLFATAEPGQREEAEEKAKQINEAYRAVLSYLGKG